MKGFGLLLENVLTGRGDGGEAGQRIQALVEEMQRFEEKVGNCSVRLYLRP